MGFRTLIDCTETDAAIAIVKERMKVAAMQVALDLRRDGIAIDLDVTYLLAYEEARNDAPAGSL